MIPKLPGTFSALGMLMAEWRQDFVRTLIGELGRIDRQGAAVAFAELRAAGEKALARDGFAPNGEFHASLRTCATRPGAHHCDCRSPTPSELTRQHRRHSRSAFMRSTISATATPRPINRSKMVNLRLVVTVPRMQDAIGRWLVEPWQPEGTCAE